MDETNVISRASLQEAIERDNRLGTARAALIEKMAERHKIHKGCLRRKSLWAYTDSSIKKGKLLLHSRA